MENVKNNKKKKIGMASAVVTAAVSFAVLFGNSTANADTYVKQDGENGFTYYSNGNKVASLVLENVDENTKKAIIFVKNDEGYFSVHSLSLIESDNKITITTTDDISKTYYVAFTNDDTLDETTASILYNNSTLKTSDEENNIYTIKNDKAEINTQKVTIINDTIQPEITEIKTSTDDYTFGSVTITIIATDNNTDPTNVLEYSINGGKSWYDENTFTVASNGEYTVYVRDKKENISNEKTINISNIITTEEKYIINKSVEHNENTTSGSSFFKYDILVNGEDGAKYYYKNVSDKDELNDVDINSVIWDTAPYSVRVNKMKSYLGIFVKSSDGTINLQTTNMNGVSLKVNNYQKQECTNEKYVANVQITTLKGNIPSNLENNLKGEIENGEVSFSVDNETKITTITVTPKDKDKSVQGDLKVSYINSTGMTEYFVVKNVVVDKEPPFVSLNGEYDNNAWHSSLYTVEVAVSDNISKSIKLDARLVKVSNGIEIIDDNLKTDIKDTGRVNSDGKRIYAIEFSGDYNKNINANLQIKATDEYGNIMPFTNICNYKVDFTNPSINNQNISGLGDYVEKGKYYNVWVSGVSDTGSSIAKVELVCGNNSIELPMIRNGYYSASVNLSEVFKDNISTGNTINLSIKVTDNSGRTTIKDIASPKYYDTIGNISSIIVASGGNKYFNDGEELVFTYKFDHKVSLDSIIVNGKSVKIDNIEVTTTEISGNYQYTFSVPYDSIKSSLTDEENVSVKVQFLDEIGNKFEDVNDSIKYYKEFTVSDIILKSNNSTSPTAVRKGDILTLTFVTDKPVTPKNSESVRASIGGKRVTVTTNDNIHWTAKYTVTGGENWNDTQNINFKLTIIDIADNKVSKELSETNISYYKPVNISDRSIKITAQNGTNMVINGDKVYITFATNHKVESVVANIAEKELIAKSDDGVNWMIEYTVDGSDDLQDEKLLYYVNNKLNINITVTDIAGNTYSAVKESFSNDDGKVRYYAPVSINDSINITPNAVKKGDSLTITFSTNDTVEKAIVTINGVECEASTEDKINWNLIYTLPEDNLFDDTKEIPITIYVRDKAGNEDTKEFLQSGAVYYGELKINDVQVISSNESDSKTVKNGDTVELIITVTEGHIISTDNILVKIGGVEAGITAIETENNNQFKATTVIGETLEDLSNIEYSISIEDSVGNKATISDTTNIEYYSALDIADNSIIIISDNKKDTSLATFGDTLTVEFAVNHKITTSSDVIINGFEVDKNNIKFIKTNEGGQSIYRAIFKIEDNFYNDDTNKDDFIIPIELSLIDKAGNTINSTNDDLSKTLVSFGAKVNIEDITVVSKNNNLSVVKADDNVKVEFITNDDIESATIKLLIGGVVVATNDITTTEINHTTTLTIPNFEELIKLGVKDLTDISVIVDIEDKYGNTDSSEKSTTIKYYGDISILGDKITVVSNNISGTTNIAKDGDIITISFTTNHEATDADITINGTNIKATSADGVNWTAQYVIPTNTFMDTKNIVISEIFIADTAYNILIKNDITSAVAYYAPIEISNISITTNNVNNGNTYAKNGNTLTVKFDINHNVKIDNILIGNGSTLKDIILGSTMSSVSNTNGTVTWTVQYIIPEETDLKDIQKINISAVVSDIAKNENSFIKESNITYYAPISINNVNISSDNSSGNNSIAKDGDDITVIFKTNHNITVDSSMIAGRNTNISGNANDWKLTYKLANGDVTVDNSNISTYIIVSDVAGNTVTYSSNTGSDTSNSVIYYKPIEQSISSISMISNEIDTNLNNGDTIYWNISITHPINTNNTYIEVDDNKVNFTFVSNTEGKYNYQASYSIPANNTLTDVGTINYNLYVNDSAKNATYKNNQEQTTKFTYYAPIQITNVAINTNNQNNGSMYAKNGDTVTVSFTSNHTISIDSATIAGLTANVSSSKDSGNFVNYTLTYTITQDTLTDLSIIPFVFTSSDVARNTTSPITNTSSGVKNSITYYAPITATAEISASGSNTAFVSNAGTVTVNLTTNHNTTISSGTVGGYNGITNGANTLKPSVTYTIPANESSMSQGALNFNCNVNDAAGNTLVVSNAQGSVVIYDRDNPTVSIVPDLSSFVNQEVTYTVTISDANIEANYITISVTIDGEKVLYPITYSDIVSSGGNTVSKQITLSKDAEYVIEVTAKDKADNNATPKTVRVTVDTTNPVINVVGIDLNVTKTYKEGQVLSDFFKIDEKNIKDIICTITDNKGNVQEWSLDKPITADMDGRQTFTLQVTDLAGNNSEVITYDFYIDNTKPKFVISDESTNKLLNTSTTETFISNMKLNISLEDLHIGDNNLDRFTMAKLIKPDKTEINLLGADATQAIIYELNSATFEDGEYTLILSAIDDMGNETGDMIYTFDFKDKSIFVKFFENKGLFYTSTTIACILIIAGIAIIVKKKKKGNN